jgi:hypothetical protein
LESFGHLQFLTEVRMKFIRITTIVLAGLTVSPLAFCACDSKLTLVEAFMQNGAETKLFTYGGWYSSNLGESVAISGDMALVAGSSAYLYRWDGVTWTRDVNFTHNRYGYSVALSGIRAVVGWRGSVYVYRFNGAQWQEEAILSGNAVSMSGRVIAVSANGFVYMYRLNGSNWVEEAKLAAGSGKANDGFGSSVSVDGDVVIIGAPGIYTGFGYQDSGKAYIYRFTGSSWKEEAKLAASDASAGDRFGRAVAVSGNVAIVGAPYDDENIENAGSAYVFRYNGSSWRQEAKLSFKGTTPSTGAYFGSAVAVDQNMAIIGTPFDVDRIFFDSGSKPGVAYVYRWDGTVWREQKILTASDSTPGNRFGAAVSISGRLAIVGAPNAMNETPNVNFYNRGAAYVYVLD